MMLVCRVRRSAKVSSRELRVAAAAVSCTWLQGEMLPIVGRGECRCDECGRAGWHRADDGRVVFINTTTHPDPLCPTSVGSSPQQQGEGGAEARGSEFRAMMAVLSEHQCVPPPHSLLLPPT
eukprot:COSAG01_NODE_9693_length_2366_cov_1.606167_3_plen_122_part_00